MSNNGVLKELSLAGIVPVIQIENHDDAVPLCRALRDGGLPVAEITFRTAAAEQAIRNVHKALPEIILGAGTVLNAEQVDRAIDAGASYIVSPGLNPKTVQHCQSRNIPIVAGCANPSDVERAIELGLTTVKFFPAEALGGLQVIKALSGPFPHIQFMPTGGINEKNLLHYLSFGRIVACGGSWMVPSDAVAAKDWTRIEKLTKTAVSLLLGLELRSIGMNTDSAEQAKKEAQNYARLMGVEVEENEASFLAGDAFVLLKEEGRGEKGDIAIACNDVDRAIWHLHRRGFTFDESTRNMRGKKTDSVYFRDQLAGFAVHLVHK